MVMRSVGRCVLGPMDTNLLSVFLRVCKDIFDTIDNIQT